MPSSLQQELDGLVQEAQNLEKALSELDEFIGQAVPKLHQMEALADGLTVAAVNAIAHHEDDLNALGQQVQTLAGTFKTEIEKVDSQIASVTQNGEAVAQKAFGSIDQVKQHVQTLHDAAAAHAQEITDEMHKFDDLIKGLEQSLGGRIQAANDAATAGVHDLQTLADKWAQSAQNLGHQIGEALAHTSDELDQKFVAPLDDAVKHFADLSKQIEDTVLANPLQALSDKLKNEILSEVQHLIDAIVQEIEKVLEDAINALMEAGEGNDAVAKAIHQVFAELEPVWHSLTDALRSVQSIWDTVKSAVSVL